MNKEDGKSCDEKCDLMEIYCDTEHLKTNQKYKNNVKETAIDFIEADFVSEVKQNQIFSFNQTVEVARLIVAELNKNFGIREKISIIDSEDFIYIEIGDNTFAELMFRKHYAIYYNRFYPKVILKKYHKFDEKLCKFIRLMACISCYVNFGSPKDGKTLISIKVIQLKNLLYHFYDISRDENSKYGYRVVSKHNQEIREAIEKRAEKEPSLRQVLDFMYAGDYKNALKILADDILEKYKYEYKEKIQKGNETLFDIDKFFNFVNNYNVRHSKSRKENKQVKQQIEPTDEQLKVYLDFGLSIYRLFCIYQDDNDKKSA